VELHQQLENQIGLLVGRRQPKPGKPSMRWQAYMQTTTKLYSTSQHFRNQSLDIKELVHHAACFILAQYTGAGRSAQGLNAGDDLGCCR